MNDESMSITREWTVFADYKADRKVPYKGLYACERDHVLVRFESGEFATDDTQMDGWLASRHKSVIVVHDDSYLSADLALRPNEDVVASGVPGDPSPDDDDTVTPDDDAPSEDEVEEQDDEDDDGVNDDDADVVEGDKPASE